MLLAIAACCRYGFSLHAGAAWLLTLLDAGAARDAQHAPQLWRVLVGAGVGHVKGHAGAQGVADQDGVVQVQLQRDTSEAVLGGVASAHMTTHVAVVCCQ